MCAQARPRRSAGILVYRQGAAGLEVLLVHPGGPFWARRNAGAWSVPKGEYDEGEQPLAAARREFAEELGTAAPAGEPLDLGEVRLRSGKLIRAWAIEGDLDAERISSNTFQLEWPRGSGRMREFPEVDRAAWLDLGEARELLHPGQVPLLERLTGILDQSSR
ncbi:MAG: NUDIX domain-containing protein [Solirubrobacteraceae bacterium]